MHTGWTYHAGFVSEPDALYAELAESVAWTSAMKSRGTASMGVPYNYAGMVYPVAPWHPAVDALRPAVAEVAGFTASNCLLNHYPTGAHGMGWHRDDVDILAPGTGIAIVSLGAERPLRLRFQAEDGFAYVQVMLAPGSLLLMSAAMQAEWQHALPRVPDVVEGEVGRISLSFREIVRVPDPVDPRAAV